MIERSIRFAILDDIRSRFPDAISWESANVLDYYQIRVISEYDVPFASISIFKSSSISITCVHPSDNSDQSLNWS